MPRVIEVAALANYRLALRFDDGVTGEISLQDRLFGPMFEPLKDANYFAKVKVDRFGAVYWDNGVDLAPESLYKKVTAR